MFSEEPSVKTIRKPLSLASRKIVSSSSARAVLSTRCSQSVPAGWWGGRLQWQLRGLGIGRQGGYGGYIEHCVSLSEHMPLGMKKTHKAAELMAALRTLELHRVGKIVICSDSEYVLLGVKGPAKRWRIKGWVGSCGPVSNVPILLLSEREREGREIVWIKVPPSRATTKRIAWPRPGSGLHAHPLYPFHQTPHTQAIPQPHSSVLELIRAACGYGGL